MIIIDLRPYESYEALWEFDLCPPTSLSSSKGSSPFRTAQRLPVSSLSTVIQPCDRRARSLGGSSTSSSTRITEPRVRCRTTSFWEGKACGHYGSLWIFQLYVHFLRASRARMGGCTSRNRSWSRAWLQFLDHLIILGRHNLTATGDKGSPREGELLSGQFKGVLVRKRS